MDQNLEKGSYLEKGNEYTSHGLYNQYKTAIIDRLFSLTASKQKVMKTEEGNLRDSFAYNYYVDVKAMSELLQPKLVAVDKDKKHLFPTIKKICELDVEFRKSDMKLTTLAHNELILLVETLGYTDMSLSNKQDGREW
jgi:hypothetical protein